MEVASPQGWGKYSRAAVLLLAPDDFTVVLKTRPGANVSVVVEGGNARGPALRGVSQLQASRDAALHGWYLGDSADRTVLGQSDCDFEAGSGPISYTIGLRPPTSNDSNYSGLDPDNVQSTNQETLAPCFN